MIPVFKPHMHKKKILSELEKILDSGWIGLGPKTQEFEDRFAASCGAKYAIAVNSCTAALHLAVLGCGIKEGDEVLVPSMTFASTALVLLYEKAVPVFVDCDPETLCMDPQDARRKITPKTKAIVPVHFGGHAADLDAFIALAKEKNLKIIEDCAHAAGGRYKNQALGTFGDFGCFSFHAVKNLPTADGGMILTDDPAANALLRKLRWLGIDKDTWSRTDKKYAWRYTINELGFKYHMNDITAVIGLVQLETLSADNVLRADLAKRYTDVLSKESWLDCPVERSHVTSAWHNYVIRLKDPSLRDDLIDYLAKNGISAGVHYEPVHFHPVFKNRSRAEHLPVTERIWTSFVTLPLYPELTHEQQSFIVSQLKSFLSRRITAASA